MTFRIRIIFLFYALSFAGIIARLFFWQVIKGEELSSDAKSQYERGSVLSAPRGNIFASDQTWLAASTKAYLVYAWLPDIEDKEDVAGKLAEVLVENTNPDGLGEESLRIFSLLGKQNVNWVPIKPIIDQNTKERIESLNVKGIGFEEAEIRSYPEASSAAHLLGFVGKNDIGLDTGYFGLEGNYDLILTGKPGYERTETDASGIPILFGSYTQISAFEGVDLVTHIDKAIQLNVEKELVKGIEKYGAKSGSVIVMNPKTGGVIAASSFPSFDPGNYGQYSNELFLNPIVSNSFEPGSVFKVIIMASALDAGVVEPGTRCDICSGAYKIDKYLIKTWDQQYYPDSTMTDVIIHSDNIGMVFVGNKLGSTKLYEYLIKFGFGKLTNIDLQGEMSPHLRDKDRWGDVDTATATFGQGVAVTPIQLVTAVSAIANDGLLMQPQVVDKLKKEDWEEDIQPIEVRRVISKKSADEITAMMVEAAKSGEAKWTYKKGFRVAGKTGTAQVPISGHYDEEKTIASFVGFAPYSDPKFVMLVTLREPESSPWASETAAPLWFSIANKLFMSYGIQPEY